MNAPTSTIGNEIDASLLTSSQSCNISHGRPQTVQDLLAALSGDKQLSMLRTTVGHVCGCLDIAFDKLMIEVLVGLAPRFTTYLQGRHHKPNSIRSYRNYLGVLLRKAKERGWTAQQPEVPEAWKPILVQIPKVDGLHKIVHDAISNGKSPGEYADADLDDWSSRRLKQGFSYFTVKNLKARFRRLVFDGGLSREMPHLSPPLPKTRYSIPVEMFPDPLRTEVNDLKRWKREECAEGRGYKGHHREITWSHLEAIICRMVGLLARNGVAVSSLDELFTKEHMQRFVKLAKEQTKSCGSTLTTTLGLVFAAVRHYPPLQDKSSPDKFSWMTSLVSQIPPDPESDKRRSKSQKWVKYSVLEQIPDMIEAEIVAKPKATERWVARMRQKQLILKWLTVLPWRQRNLRQVRLVSRGQSHANIFQEEVSEVSPMDLPPWAEAALQVDPDEKLWQFAFSEEETKARREVRGVIPRPLVPLLEDFLAKYRSRLVKGTDPGTLFLNYGGRPFGENSIRDFVGAAALRYAKRRVTPHLFRDIFAVAFLKDTRDYLSLSKVLWHKNPKITIELYGRFFDESAGARVVEGWFEGRKDMKQMQAQVPNGTLHEQLRNLQVRLREKTAELDDLRGAISTIEAKIGTTGTRASTIISSAVEETWPRNNHTADSWLQVR